MQAHEFKPKYTPLTWALITLYAAPWLFAACNALWGGSTADWRLFWLLSGTVWIFAGLLHMKDALVRRVSVGGGIAVQMVFMKPVSQRAAAPVCVSGGMLVFERQAVELRYLANAAQLMRLLEDAAGRGELELVRADSYAKPGWTAERNLMCLIVFALYMAVMLALRLYPLRLIGPATDTLLLGWAAMLPVLLAVKLARLIRRRKYEQNRGYHG